MVADNSRMIGLASGIVPECGPEATIDAAARGGFDMVGLWIECDQWNSALTRRVRRKLQETAMSVIDVEVIWIKPGALDDNHKRILDIAAEIGAQNALVVSADPDTGATIAKLAELCEHGKSVGVRVALEFGLFNEVKTIDAALSILAQVDSPAAALLIDTLHLARSGGTPADAARVPRHLLTYAQFCDASAVGPHRDDAVGILREAVDERIQTGEGALPLAAVLRELPGDLPLSLELRSKYLRDAYPDPVERANAVARVTRNFLRHCDRAPTNF